MKNSLKILTISSFVIIVIIMLIGTFTFLKPDPPKIVIKNASTNITQKSNIFNIGRIGDPVSRNNSSIWWSENVLRMPTERNLTTSSDLDYWGRKLPYPRISIDYSAGFTRTIGSEDAGEGNMFLILTLDIRNYGYKYFDAHPSKFRIVKEKKIEPLADINTGNMLDAVIPNNSRGRGDLVFLVGERDTWGRPSLEYTLKNYEILYNSGFQETNIVDEEDEEDEEKDEEENQDDGYID